MSPTTAERAARLRARIAHHTVAIPGAINALSARLIEAVGFEAVYLSGAVLANSVGGLPDTGLMTLTEAEQHARAVARAVTLPLIMDADTGFGETENVARTVRVLEEAGVSAIHLEDQEFPKRCGHLEGKRLVPIEDFLLKLDAALRARACPDFMVIARTDARSVDGIDAAIHRARRYRDAGADAIFPEALASVEEFGDFARAVGGNLLANMTEFGKSPYLTVAELGKLGYNMVIFPVTLQRCAMFTMRQVLEVIKEQGTQRSFLDRMQTRAELYELLNYDPDGSTQ